jgi:Tfp pilus assembly protein PilF
MTGRALDAKRNEAALEIDPLSHNFLAELGQMHYFAREYEEAEKYCSSATGRT